MSDLISDIYEGAIVGENWRAVLGKISARCGSMGGLLFALGDPGVRWTGSGAAVRLYEEAIEQGWQNSPHNSRVSELVEARHNGFMIDVENRPADFTQTNPMYRDFLVPRGAMAAAATHIVGACGDNLILTIEGFPSLAAAQAHRDFLDELRPHLARSALVASRLNLERARAMTSALNSIGVAAAVVSRRGRLRSTNDLFIPLIGRAVFDQVDGLRWRDVAANEAFRAALLRMQTSFRHARSIPVPPNEEAGPKIVHLVPIAGEARDVFSDDAILVVVTGARRGAVRTELLETLFDLTPAEAKLSKLLAEGRSLRKISDESERSIHTLRTQVKAILSKTNTRSQLELVALLKDLSLGVD